MTLLKIGQSYQFSYDEKNNINRITNQKDEKKNTITLQEKKDYFSVKYKKTYKYGQSIDAVYKFDEFGILQEGESNEISALETIKESYSYYIEIDEDTHFPTQGEMTSYFEDVVKKKTYNATYTFGIVESEGKLVFWKNKNGKETDYPIGYTIPDERVSSEITAQNKRLIMAFCLMLPDPQSPL